LTENYNFILNRMQENFKNLSGFSADDASDIGIRLKVLAGEIFTCYENLEWLKLQAFPQSATGNHLDLHAEERSLTRKNAVKAAGTLEFSRTPALDYDVIIPAGSICSTAGTQSVHYETLQEAILPAGELSVQVESRALIAGTQGNASINSVNIMISPPPGITSVNNITAFSGGTNAETDSEFRKRLLESYKNIPNGTNSAFYKNIILNYNGINSVKILPRIRGRGTLDIYAAAQGSAPSTELINTIQAELDNLKEINVDILLQAASLFNINFSFKISLKENYIFSEVQINCQNNIQEFFNSLSVGESVIMAAVGNVIFNTEGVNNYQFLSGLTQDINISSSDLAVLGNLVISEWI